MADKDESESSESTSSDDPARDPGTVDETEDAVEPEPTDARGDVNGNRARVPEPVGAGRAKSGRAERSGSTSTSGVAKSATTEKKGRATAKRDSGEVKPQRTGPITFVKESVAELRKVVYPTGPQLVNYFVVVLIFVLFIIAYVSLLDLGLGKAMFSIFA